MKHKSTSSAIEVFSGNSWEASMVKNLLENEGIFSFVKNDVLGRTPVWSSGTAGNMGISVMVSEMDIETAKKIVDAFLKNRPSL
ncbi:MAG: DUF2007-related protein [Chitinophagaceae bacterium]